MRFAGWDRWIVPLCCGWTSDDHSSPDLIEGLSMTSRSLTPSALLLSLPLSGQSWKDFASGSSIVLWFGATAHDRDKKAQWRIGPQIRMDWCLMGSWKCEEVLFVGAATYKLLRYWQLGITLQASVRAVGTIIRDYTLSAFNARWSYSLRREAVEYMKEKASKSTKGNNSWAILRTKLAGNI